MTRIPGWLRSLRQAIPLLRGHAGRHIQNFVDLAWADQLASWLTNDFGLRANAGLLGQVNPPCAIGMRERRQERRERTRPVTLDATPPCYGPDPRWALEVHHDLREPVPGARDNHRLAEPRHPHHRDWTPRPLSAVRDGLAPWVEKALAGAQVGDTVIDTDHTTLSRWLENVTGGDPYDGCGSSDSYVDRLFYGMAGAL